MGSARRRNSNNVVSKNQASGKLLYLLTDGEFAHFLLIARENSDIVEEAITRSFNEGSLVDRGCHGETNRFSIREPYHNGGRPNPYKLVESRMRAVDQAIRQLKQ